jgi:hypothetical protein
MFDPFGEISVFGSVAGTGKMLMLAAPGIELISGQDMQWESYSPTHI